MLQPEYRDDNRRQKCDTRYAQCPEFWDCTPYNSSECNGKSDCPGECMVKRWEDGSKMCGRGYPACSTNWECSPRKGNGTPCGPDESCLGKCTPPKWSNGNQACHNFGLPECPPDTQCVIGVSFPSVSDAATGECVPYQDILRTWDEKPGQKPLEWWENGRQKCGVGYPMCPQQNSCLARDIALCDADPTNCVGVCTLYISENGF